jgi:hypothetical protein
MFKRIGLAALAIGLLAAGSRASAQSADSLKQVAVVSIAPYDELLEDANFLGALAGKNDLAQMLEGLLAGFTGGVGSEGLGKDRPWGAAVLTDGASFQVVGMLPVADFEKLLSAASANLPEPVESDGVYQFQVGPMALAVKHEGDWAYLSQNAQHLQNLPKDPAKLLAPIAKDYDVAVRFYVANVPEAFRQQGLAMIRGGLQMGLQQQAGETDAQFEVRRRMVENQLETFEKSAAEIDQITLGVDVDAQEKQVHLDLDTTVLPGSSLAKQLAAQANAKTNFAGFASDDAAAYFSVASKLGPDDIKQTLEQLSGVRSQLERAIDEEENLPDETAKGKIKEVAGKLLDAFEATIKSGSIDAGGRLQLGDTLTFAAGGYVADGAELEKAFKELVALAKNEPDFPGVKFDAEKYKDVRFHTTSVPVKEEEGQKVLGETLDVVVGIGPKAGYLAIGQEGLELLKQVIDESAKQPGAAVPPMQVNVSLAPIFKFAAEKGEEPQVAMLAEALAQAGGQDHVKLTVTPVTNGQKVRLLLEQGVLEALGQAGKLSQGQAVGAGF